jgi:hypothetical protein
MTGDAVGSERLRNKQGQNEETQRKGTYTTDNRTICTLVWVLLHLQTKFPFEIVPPPSLLGTVNFTEIMERNIRECTFLS